jgi:GNAT superfamily N-acetyltransferase
MIIDWRDADLKQVLDLWNTFHPERYRIDMDILRINTVDSVTFDWGASVVDVDFEGIVRGFVSVKKPPATFHKVADPDAMHLSGIAFTEPSFGIDLLSEAKTILRQRGVTTLLFGMDSRHFWPGVPTDFPMLNDFLTIEGFSLSGEYFDIERDLSDYQPPKPLPTEDVEFRVLTADDHASIVKFFEREFPGRWRYDILWKIEKEGHYEGLIGLIYKGEVHGFAAIQNKDTRFPIGGAVWRNSLGDDYGALGPIGLSQAVRGFGWGGALLSAGLLELKARGCRQTIIDWTTLGEFYGKHGFEKSRLYRSAKLAI